MRPPCEKCGKPAKAKRLCPQHYRRWLWRRQFTELLAEAKALPCADCGVAYPVYVMDFDHRDPDEKSFNIGSMYFRSWKMIRAEIAKCDVVCANCHRERTHKRRPPHKRKPPE